MSPSGLNFTQVNPLIQQLEKRVRSSDLQALRVLWERSNCPSLNSPSARRLLPSRLLLLTTCIPPSPPGLKVWDGDTEREISLLPSKYSWDWSFLHLQEQKEKKDAHEPVLGNEKWKHLITCCLLSSPHTTHCRYEQQPDKWTGKTALISEPARSLCCCHAPFKAGSTSSPGFHCSLQFPLSQTQANVRHLCQSQCALPAMVYKQTGTVSGAKYVKSEHRAQTDNSRDLQTVLVIQSESALLSFPFLPCPSDSFLLPKRTTLFFISIFKYLYLSQVDCGLCFCLLQR